MVRASRARADRRAATGDFTAAVNRARVRANCERKLDMLFRKLARYERAQLEAGNAVVLEGKSGIGKTESQEQLFDSIWRNSTEHWGFGIHYMASWNPSDVLGAQYKGHETFNDQTYTISEPCLPLWMRCRDPRDGWKEKPAWAFDRVNIFFDEYGQLDVEVKKPLDNVILKHEIGPWRLPPRSYIALATNTGSGYGVTKNMYQSVARLAKFSMIPDKISFLQYCETPYQDRKTNRKWEVSPLFKAYAAQRFDKVTEPEPKDITQWCNPRSFLACDRALQVAYPDGVDTNDPQLEELMKANIGKDVTADMAGWFKFRIELPQYDDVRKDPLNTSVPSQADRRYLMLYQLAHDVEPQDFSNIIKYMMRFPQDMAVPFVRTVIARDPGVFGAHPALLEWSDRNATLLSLLTSLGG